jgi:hypothetical protein
MRIEFVNHASVLISEGDTAILTDPLYSGPAFHKGWSLLVETPDDAVLRLLERVTDIWLSHEHPDHFSIAFFRTFGEVLRAREIPVWFQKIKDQRVATFIRQQGITLREMPFGEPCQAGAITLTCYKDDWYDSLASFKSADRHVLNLNDCHVDTERRAGEILEKAGPCDVLLTQFSYAAWKGGPDNRAWRAAAAAEKLDNIALQARLLKPRVVIPFASFVRFDNARNAYLNDAANTPRHVVARFRGAPFDVQVMKPGDVFTGEPSRQMTEDALAFWDAAYARAAQAAPMMFQSKTTEDIQAAFETCLKRVSANNSRAFMRFAQRFSPIRVFQPVIVACDDIDQRFRIDLAQGELTQVRDKPHLTMHSESLWFLFQNSFGFDTLTVNGCLEETQEDGFARAAKSLSVETLNNLGIRFGPGIVFEPRLIAVFLQRLIAVQRRLRRKGANASPV